MQLKYLEIPAASVRHVFECEEEGQTRGVPLMATALDALSDSREFSSSTMTAARMATLFALVFSATNPETEDFQVEDFIEDLESGVVFTAPPGYEPHQVRPEQPHTGYSEFTGEKRREQSGPMGMPQMLASLDAKNHSFSGGMIDLGSWSKIMDDFRAFMERNELLPDLKMSLGEAILTGEIPAPPRDFIWNQDTTFQWDAMPHVDPVKDATGAKGRLGNLTSDPITEGRRSGHEFSETAKRWAAARKAWIAAGNPAEQFDAVYGKKPDEVAKPADSSNEDDDRASA
jgi:capsid protein